MTDSYTNSWLHCSWVALRLHCSKLATTKYIQKSRIHCQILLWISCYGRWFTNVCYYHSCLYFNLLFTPCTI